MTGVAMFALGTPIPGHGDCGTIVSPQGPCQETRDLLQVASALAGLGLGLIASAVLFHYASDSIRWRDRLTLGRVMALGVVVAVVTALLIYGVFIDQINLDRD
jgi:hypothetical protein